MKIIKNSVLLIYTVCLIFSTAMAQDILFSPKSENDGWPVKNKNELQWDLEKFKTLDSLIETNQFDPRHKLQSMIS